MKDLNREIEINRIIGEMAGMLRGILMPPVGRLTESNLDAINNLLKRYDDFFKGEK